MRALDRTVSRDRQRASGRRGRALATGVALAVVALVSGCAGGSSGPVAPAASPPDSGIVAVDAVQAAIGGNWGDLTVDEDSACRLGDEGGRGDGIQTVSATVSIAVRSEEDALAAAQLASAALAESGVEPGDVIQANGIASVTATWPADADAAADAGDATGSDADVEPENAGGGSMTVTIDTARAYIEHRTACVEAP